MESGSLPGQASLETLQWRGRMAETTKLSVEKALQKLRNTDPKSKDERQSEKMDELDEEIKRMRAQRLRLDRQRPPVKGDRK
jgi:hypothetical protein